MSRKFPSALALQAALAPLMALPSPAADPAPDKPNIIVIMADDIGWGDASCYGATKIQTPNIDRLAREGVRFENGHASAAVCTPTRYSMLTGQYAFRQDTKGVNRGVAEGDSPLVIPTETITAPQLFREAGYRTGVIGKWHLGFGETKPDFNQALRPGPLEVGFDEYFGFPATNDRIPTVLIRDHHVQNLDPQRPIIYTYNPEQAAKQGLSNVAAGRKRIGWGRGGESAWWDDQTLSDVHTEEVLKFLERNQANPFFLVFNPHNVHAPPIPGPRFAGKSGLSDRADMLLEFDDTLGQILQQLDRLGLAQNTLVIFTSDNGAYVTDEKGHRPNGPFRGIKSQLWEGGHRVPLIVRWPARIAPHVSTDLASTLDLPATICASAGITPPHGSLPDSFNLLPALLGEKQAPRRDHLIVQSGNGHLALRSGPWKYLPDLAVADGWKSPHKKPGTPARPALFNLAEDPGETMNLIAAHPDVAEHLADRLAQTKSKPRTPPN